MRTLTAQDIRRLRLANLWLNPRGNSNATDVVAHCGALQSQEIWSGLWSIGVRSTSLAVDQVLQACEDATILRTWPLRNTVHFIDSSDVRWMLDLAETFAYKSLEKRREFLGLSAKTSQAACELLASELDHGKPVARADVLALLEEAGLLTQSAHSYHLLWFAAQQGVICLGPQRGTTQTIVKLDRWVTNARTLERADALGELAARYFISHGPAPATELRRWSGLGMKDVRAAIAKAGDRLCEVPTEFGAMLIDAAQVDQIERGPVDPADPSRQVMLLSGFDEYVLGYGDRSAIMEPDQLALVVPGNNGMFRPTIIDDGTVIGTWKRKVTKKHVDITPEPFDKFTKRQRRSIEDAATDYGRFLKCEARVIWSND